MWGVLQEKVYTTPITDLDDLKHRMKTERAKLDHAVVAAAVRRWRRRLSACDRARGGHFEHSFYFWHRVFAITAADEAFVDQSNRTVQLQADIPVWSVTTLCVLIHNDRLIHKVK